MTDFKTDNDALWTEVASQLVGLVKTRLSIPKGRSYFSIASGAHKKLIEYWAWFGSRDGKAQVDIETFGGEEAKAAIEAIIATAPEGHIIKTVEAKQGAKNKDKWSWPITTPYADLNDKQLAKWYVDTITALYTFFEGMECAPNVDMSKNTKLAEEQAKAETMKAEAEAAKAELEALKKAQAEAEAAKAELEALKKAQAEAEAARAEIEALKKAQGDAEKAKAAAPASKNDGALSGAFTVDSSGRQICFSKGMLQFNPAKYEFRFAENQYDSIGVDNKKVAPNYDGWIDTFGWGTSGYMGCEPTEGSTNNSEYGPSSGDIAGTNYDWGVYNPITNGGNKEGLWRTPTESEWKYLVSERPNASKLRVSCTICGVHGFMLMPDNFWENRVRLPIDTTVDNCETNTYDSGQWTQLEALGVVFMPKVYCGWVNSSKTWEYFFEAYVWLSTWRDRDNASIGSRINVYGCDKRKKRGIRLIKDVK